MTGDIGSSSDGDQAPLVMVGAKANVAMKSSDNHPLILVDCILMYTVDCCRLL